MKKLFTKNALAVTFLISATLIVIYHFYNGTAFKLFPLWKFYLLTYLAGSIVGVLAAYTYRKNHQEYLVENEKLKFELRKFDKNFSATTKVLKDKIEYYSNRSAKLEADVEELNKVKGENELLKEVNKELQKDKEDLAIRVYQLEAILKGYNNPVVV